MLKKRNFRPLIYLRWQAGSPRNNVSKATSEWRVVTSVQPAPLVWFMWPGSNKNGNQINPATLQVEGCLIELSKAWLRLKMIMLGKLRGVHLSASSKDAIHLLRPLHLSHSFCLCSTVKCIQNNYCLPASPPFWRLFVVWRTPPVSPWWIPCTQNREMPGPGFAGKLTDLWIT